MWYNTIKIRALGAAIVSGLLGRENKPGLCSRADRCHFAKATHSVALNRTWLTGKDGFCTNRRADISDKAFPMGQFPGNSHVCRSVTVGIDLGHCSQRRQSRTGAEPTRRPYAMLPLPHVGPRRPNCTALLRGHVAALSLMPRRAARNG